MSSEVEDFVLPLIATKSEIVDVEFYPSSVRVFVDRSYASASIDAWLASIGTILESRYKVGLVIDAHGSIIPKFPDVAPGPSPIVPAIDWKNDE